MIDIEQDVFAIVAPVLRKEFSGISVANTRTNSPAKFPAVSIVEADNSVHEPMRTLEIENAAALMYEVHIFSNLVGGYQKIEAKNIAQVVDREFSRLGFTRTMRSEIDNLSDSSIYHYVLRYKAVADNDFWIYQS